MQGALNFGERPPERGLIALRDRLRSAFGTWRCDWRLTPVQQLIKSIISSRTLDKASWAAFWRLWERFGTAEAIMAAPVREIEQAISGVTWPDQKAGWVKAALLRIRERRRDFGLAFLGEAPVAEAMGWL
jgi:endonuclease-3